MIGHDAVVLRSPRTASIVWFLGLVVCCVGVILLARPAERTEELTLFVVGSGPRDVELISWSVGQTVGGLLLAIGLIVGGLGLGLARSRRRPVRARHLKRLQIAAAVGLLVGVIIALVAPDVGSPYVGDAPTWDTLILMWGSIRTIGAALVVASLTTFAVTAGLDAGGAPAPSTDPTPA